MERTEELARVYIAGRALSMKVMGIQDDLNSALVTIIKELRSSELPVMVEVGGVWHVVEKDARDREGKRLRIVEIREAYREDDQGKV